MLSGLLRCTYGFPVAPPSICKKSVVKSQGVECLLRCSSIVIDITAEGTSDIVLCRVMQSRNEFLYEIQKVSAGVTRADLTIDQRLLQMAQALDSFSQLQAFLILLIAPVNLNCRRAHHTIAFRSAVPGVELEKEVGVLFYHQDDFSRFKAIAGRGSGFGVWKKDDYFMACACILLYYSSLILSPSATLGC